MAVESKFFKLAQHLVTESLDQDGKVSLEKVEQVLTELRKLPKSRSIHILNSYHTLIKNKISSYECTIEKSGPVNDAHFSECVSSKLPSNGENKPVIVVSSNDSLIAGFRLKLGDDVYEDSIACRLSRLKKSLT